MVGQAVVAGGIIGFAAGAAARLAMRILFLMNPETRGLIVGEIFPVGGFTAQGTGLILFQGAILGAIAGVFYGLARPALPRRSVLTGLLFGAWLVAVFLGLLVIGEERDFRLFSPFPIAAGLFGSIFVAFGLVLAPVVDRPIPASQSRSISRVRSTLTWVILGVSALAGSVIFVVEATGRA